MPVNRHLWKFTIDEHDVPAWPCPGCGVQALELVKDSFRTIVDRNSRFAQNYEGYPSNVEGRFVCLLECLKCHETCAVSGNYEVTQDQDEDGIHYRDCGKPTSVTPPPSMFGIPPGCPKEVKREIRAAFGLYWCDFAASLNRIRNAIELILNEQKVPRTELTKSGKRVRLSLHRRIEKYELKQPSKASLCKRLMAVKHLGNAGSHPEDKVDADDVFDGLDILELVLHTLYSGNIEHINTLVSQINKRKGPRKAKGR